MIWLLYDYMIYVYIIPKKYGSVNDPKWSKAEMIQTYEVVLFHHQKSTEEWNDFTLGVMAGNWVTRVQNVTRGSRVAENFMQLLQLLSDDHCIVSIWCGSNMGMDQYL